MKKVYVVGTQKHYADFINDVELVDNITDAEIVIFTGGEDVDPSLYGEEKHRTTFSNKSRDLGEVEEWNKVSTNQLVVGICRGSQFLCVMNGGKLIQNCSNHAIYDTHIIVNSDNMAYDITSTHHQMQYPYNLDYSDYTILYYSPRRSCCYEGSGIDPEIVYDHEEPEIVKYHKKGNPICLAIQGHPEYMRKEAPVVIMLNELINNTLQEIKNTNIKNS